MPGPNSPFSRRDLLKSAAAAGLAGALVPPGFAADDPTFSAADPDRIRRENERPGTRDWIATNVRIDPATRYRSPAIEGFASHLSATTGDRVKLFVSTNPASKFTIDLYRLGYYQGHGGRQVEHLGPFDGRVQPDPPIGPGRVRECIWEPCAELTIPDDWTSGVYLGKLTAEPGGEQSYLTFVVRDDRRADLMVQVSDFTWNAYNRWPDQFALYDDGKKEWYWGPDVVTSFDRPYGKYCQILDAPLSVGSGEFLLWEFPLSYWLEEQGYDVSYVSNLDLHVRPAGLARARGFLSVGHDEYWTTEMFGNLQAAIANGLNVAFLSANSLCGVVELKPAADGRPDRAITRVGRYGSPEPWELKDFPEMGRFPRNGPNEATLIGARSTFPTTGGGDWICRMPDHWLFAKTGMAAGDGIPGLVGWEFHGAPAPIPGLEIVASGPTRSPRGEGTYTATLYPGPKGNLVFNAATIWWSDGLSEPPGYVRPSVYTTPRGPNPRVQQITRNLLDHFLRPA